MHTTINAVDPVVWRWFDGPDRVHLWWIWAGLWALLATAIVAITGPRLTSRESTACHAPATTAATTGADRSSK